MQTTITNTKNLLELNKNKAIISNLLDDIRSVLLLAYSADSMLEDCCFFTDSVSSFKSIVNTIVLEVEREFNKNSNSCPVKDQSE